MSLSKVFSHLPSRPLLVDLTIEEGSRLKVIYGSKCGFHAIDLDTSNQIDIYLPNQVSSLSVDRREDLCLSVFFS